MRRPLAAFVLCLSALPALAGEDAAAKRVAHDKAFAERAAALSRKMPELKYGDYQLRNGKFFRRYDRDSASGESVELRGTRECCRTGRSLKAAGAPPAPVPLAFAWDGKDKVAVVRPIYSSGGGSGFYHGLAVAYEDGGGAPKTALALASLGDRVEVTAFEELEGGAFRVEYLDYAEGQSFADDPIVKKAKTFVVRDGRLVERARKGGLREVPRE